MKNGLTLYRERAEMSKAELARLAETTRAQIGRLEKGERKLTREWANRLAPFLKCTPHELLFPNVAQDDFDKFRNVFAIAEDAAEPSISLHRDLYTHLLPGVALHKLRVVMVEDDDMHQHIAKGDAVILDVGETRAVRPGVYLIDIAGVQQWRFLSPTTDGKISVDADNPKIAAEKVDQDSLTILGRARLHISTI